ncbi:MAG: hypothetical protein LBT78_00050 [Tannerella sp.]|jgi:peptidoglycan/LPS O-acetylase OafA/YrhL|nr:hypothetical protein [Tannerella sp.]
MKKRRIIQRVILILMALVGLACLILYLALRPEKPWMAFYVACCGGVLIVNLLIVLIFVRKNVT